MKYKALRSFCGIVNARSGQELEIKDKAVAKDLLSAHYIEPIEEEPAPVTAVKKTTRKAVKKAEGL